ncbi:MAG: hypothetical protein KUL75_00705 [Sterolibacterium sp.]|nr:hypothetical protein [Sterolibacterium sp.]
MGEIIGYSSSDATKRLAGYRKQKASHSTLSAVFSIERGKILKILEYTLPIATYTVGLHRKPLNILEFADT